jgi:hypothetical protein
LYCSIERRLKEGQGWPDCSHSNSVHTHGPSASAATSTANGSFDGLLLDKLVRHEPLLPGRRANESNLSHQTSPSSAYGRRLSRERSNYRLDEELAGRLPSDSVQLTSGLTQEALHELVSPRRLPSRQAARDVSLKNPGALSAKNVRANELSKSRQSNQSSVAAPPTRQLLLTQRGTTDIYQNPLPSKVKPRSLPNSTLDHANQHGFQLPYDPLGCNPDDPRIAKSQSRISHFETNGKSHQHSTIRNQSSKSINQDR